MMKPIVISLSPNTEANDVSLAWTLLFQPWRWKRGETIENLEYEFAEYVGRDVAVSFNSGRSALLAILASLGFQKGDEVLLQAFTCNAVPNPVLWQGLKSVYVDCKKEDYNMDARDLERKITSKSKAVIVQHTFGIPADLDEIEEVCRKHNLILIEDCAHALGATYKGKSVGTFGKASFFSFSRDKAISSVYGGMATTNDAVLAQKLREFQRGAGHPSLFWIKQQLLHPLFMNWVILPTYSVFGKYLLVLLQVSHLLSKAVHWKEKQGKKPGYFPKALPNALACLALRQLRKLERFNQHRKEIAGLYERELGAQAQKEGSMFLRFPLQHERSHEIIKKAWEQNLLLGDWYTSPIAPDDTNLEKMGYVKGSCPVAESLSKTTLNLPTHIHIGDKEVKKIVEFLKLNGS